MKLYCSKCGKVMVNEKITVHHELKHGGYKNVSN